MTQDYRSTAREHRRVDTALYGRARAMLALLKDVNRLLPLMPQASAEANGALAYYVTCRTQWTPIHSIPACQCAPTF